MDWQPIETAPKDGSAILVGWWDRKDWLATTVSWGEVTTYSSDKRQDWRLVKEGAQAVTEELLEDPTHWLPLPPPPVIRATADSAAPSAR